MNIWLFNPFDVLPWEGKPQRYASLAASLADQGHRVVHWSSGFSHSFKARREVPASFDRAALPYAIELVDCPAYDSNISLRRIVNHRAYGRGLVREGRRAVEQGRHARPDLILASMPPVEGPSAALALKRQFGCKVVLDVMDAWPDTLLQALGRSSCFVPRSVAGALLWPYARQLRRACREADAVCAQSQAFAAHAREYGATGEVRVFYLGSSSFEVACSPLAHNQEPRTKNQLRLLYLGSMGQVYDLRTLVEAVLRLLDQGVPVRLDLVGEGEQRAALERQVREAGQEAWISFHGFLSGLDLEAVMVRADVGIIPMHPESRVAVPYKAGDYLSAGLAIVNTLPGELESKLSEYGCGRSYRAGDPASLIEALRTWLADPAKLEAAQTGARRLFEAEFDADMIYPEFVEWLGSV